MCARVCVCVGCDSRGRSRRRLVDQGTASVILAPPVAPHTQHVRLDLILPPACTFTAMGAGGGGGLGKGGGAAGAGMVSGGEPLQRFRAFWLIPPGRVAAGDEHPQGREVEVVKGHMSWTDVTDNAGTSPAFGEYRVSPGVPSETHTDMLAELETDTGPGADIGTGKPLCRGTQRGGGGGKASLVVSLSSDHATEEGRAMLRAAAAANALVVEVEMVYEYTLSDRAGGVTREHALIVFPTAQACQQHVAGPCRWSETLQGDVTTVKFEVRPPHTGWMIGSQLPSGVGGGGEVDLEERGRLWEAVMVLMLLSGEYTSRHLQQLQHLPDTLLGALSAASPREVPARAHGAIVHWVVLILLHHPGAEEGLEQSLFPFASRGINDPRCYTGDMYVQKRPSI